MKETERKEKWPERTIYELTEKGSRAVIDWLREALAEPSDEFPEFPAAVAFIPLLSPEDAQWQLEKREAALSMRLAQLDSQPAEEEILRLFLLENELLRATLSAELEWVRSVIDDLRSGRLARPSSIPSHHG